MTRSVSLLSKPPVCGIARKCACLNGYWDVAFRQIDEECAGTGFSVNIRQKAHHFQTDILKKGWNLAHYIWIGDDRSEDSLDYFRIQRWISGAIA